MDHLYPLTTCLYHLWWSWQMWSLLNNIPWPLQSPVCKPVDHLCKILCRYINTLHHHQTTYWGNRSEEWCSFLQYYSPETVIGVCGGTTPLCFRSVDKHQLWWTETVTGNGCLMSESKTMCDLTTLSMAQTLVRVGLTHELSYNSSTLCVCTLYIHTHFETIYIDKSAEKHCKRKKSNKKKN